MDASHEVKPEQVIMITKEQGKSTAAAKKIKIKELRKQLAALEGLRGARSSGVFPDDENDEEPFHSDEDEAPPSMQQPVDYRELPRAKAQSPSQFIRNAADANAKWQKVLSSDAISPVDIGDFVACAAKFCKQLEKRGMTGFIGQNGYQRAVFKCDDADQEYARLMSHALMCPGAVSWACRDKDERDGECTVQECLKPELKDKTKEIYIRFAVKGRQAGLMQDV